MGVGFVRVESYCHVDVLVDGYDLPSEFMEKNKSNSSRSLEAPRQPAKSQLESFMIRGFSDSNPLGCHPHRQYQWKMVKFLVCIEQACRLEGMVKIL